MCFVISGINNKWIMVESIILKIVILCESVGNTV